MAGDELPDLEVTMPLTHELEALAKSYLEGRTAVEDLRHWLVEHAQGVVDAADPRLDDLDGELWLLISEWDRGDRDEASVRDDLASFLRERNNRVLIADSSSLPTTASAADSSGR
jgi:hypothetical protein